MIQYNSLLECSVSSQNNISRYSVSTTTSGTTTLVDPPSSPEELHKVPLPPDPLPELPGLPEISEFNQRVAAVRHRVEQYNRALREGPSTPQQHLVALLARIQSRVNLDEVAFPEGNITYRQLWRIDESSNPHLYTEASLQEGAAYQPPCFQDAQSKGEEKRKERSRRNAPCQYQTCRESIWRSRV